MTPDPAGTPTRRAALKLLDAVMRRGLPLEASLDAACGELDRGDDRAFAHAMAAEVLRRQPDLDALIDAATPNPLAPDAKARFALRLALVQALVMDTPAHAAISTILPLMDGGPRRLVHAVFSTVMRDPVLLPDPPNLPPEVEKRWKSSWGTERVTAARQSILRPPIDLSLAYGADTIAWAERLGGTSLATGHVRIPSGSRIIDLDGYDEGQWWVQDIAASLPARLLGAGEGRRVLDLCAAPGGKTMQLASAGWVVTALDQSESRLARLQENLERTGLSADIVVGDAGAYGSDAAFDAVLLDAPCSATGIFRRHPDVLHRATDRVIAECAAVQAQLIDHAAGLVKPDGLLIYAVCSLEADEGEQIAKGFLARNGDWRLEPVQTEELPAGFAPDKVGRVRVMPGTLADSGGCDGFFVARFRRM